MSPTARRAALVLAAGAITAAASACQAAARPFSRFSSGEPSAPRCEPNGPATLKVVNQGATPYEIHVSRNGGPRVWLARAPVGSSTITVLGPADHTARYSVIHRDKPVTESTVTWRHRTLKEQGVTLELQCSPAGATPG